MTPKTCMTDTVVTLPLPSPYEFSKLFVVVKQYDGIVAVEALDHHDFHKAKLRAKQLFDKGAVGVVLLTVMNAVEYTKEDTP